jgi:capsular polysaccharide export protein
MTGLDVMGGARRPHSDVGRVSAATAEDLSAMLSLDFLAPDAHLGAASEQLRRISYLKGFFGGRRIVRLDESCAAALGWGVKRSGARALDFAARTGRPAILLEDGFLRSVGLGKAGVPPVSIVLDDEWVYYDASRPSRLERLIAADANCEDARGAGEALARWRETRLSKYNLGLDAPLPQARGKIVLVDQVAGDLSLAGAGATSDILARIVATAQERGLRDRLVLRVHPDVAAGKAQGLIAPHARSLDIPVLACDRCAPALLDEAQAIWTVSSALGFEALLRGVPVTTFAAPFYAGWGLTEDLADDDFARAAFARRRPRRTLVNLFACAFLLYPRYRDPIDGQPLDFHGAVDRILEWRAREGEVPGRSRVFFGSKRWKKRSY